jgi:hypothetical protein
MPLPQGSYLGPFRCRLVLGLAGHDQERRSGCPQFLWVILAMLLGVVVVWQGFARAWVGVVILWAMPAARAARLKPGACCAVSALPGLHRYRKGHCSTRAQAHQCLLQGQARSARPTVQGMPAEQALRTGMRPAGRAGRTAGLQAPPLARCTAGLLGPGGCARPPGLISQLWSRRTFPPAKRWQVSRQCRA